MEKHKEKVGNASTNDNASTDNSKSADDNTPFVVESLSKTSRYYKQIDSLKKLVLIGVVTLILLPIGDRLTGSFVPFSIADRSGYCFDISEVDDLTPSDKLTLSEDKVGVFQSCLNMKVLNIIPIQFTGFELSVFLLSVAGVILLCLYIRSAIKEILREFKS